MKHYRFDFKNPVGETVGYITTEDPDFARGFDQLVSQFGEPARCVEADASKATRWRAATGSWTLHGQIVRLAKKHYDISQYEQFTHQVALVHAIERLIAWWSDMELKYVPPGSVLVHTWAAWCACWLPDLTPPAERYLWQLVELGSGQEGAMVERMLSHLAVTRVDQLPAELPEDVPVDVLV